MKDNELSENSRVFMIVREHAPHDYCQLSLDTGEIIAREILEGLLEWVIKRRQCYKTKKQEQASTDPLDVQSQVVLGVKMKALQSVIDKLQSLKCKYLEVDETL